jgi:hypothetical protein
VKRKKGKINIKTGAPRHKDRPQDRWARCDHDWKGRERKGSCELATLSCHCLPSPWRGHVLTVRPGGKGGPSAPLPQLCAGRFHWLRACLTWKGRWREGMTWVAPAVMAPIRSQLPNSDDKPLRFSYLATLIGATMLLSASLIPTRSLGCRQSSSNNQTAQAMQPPAPLSLLCRCLPACQHRPTAASILVSMQAPEAVRQLVVRSWPPHNGRKPPPDQHSTE